MFEDCPANEPARTAPTARRVLWRYSGLSRLLASCTRGFKTKGRRFNDLAIEAGGRRQRGAVLSVTFDA